MKSLSPGDIKCIGATTSGEYRRYIESDPALERRFEKVIVNEPSRQEAKGMKIALFCDTLDYSQREDRSFRSSGQREIIGSERGRVADSSLHSRWQIPPNSPSNHRGHRVTDGL